MNDQNSKDKDDGILGEGLAEMARKKLRSRQQQLDDILRESEGTKEPASKPKPKKDTSKKSDSRDRAVQDFL